jgi:hypothetical protein
MRMVERRAVTSVGNFILEVVARTLLWDARDAIFAKQLRGCDI